MPLFERKFVKYSTWKLSLVVEATQTIADIAIAGVAAQAFALTLLGKTDQLTLTWSLGIGKLHPLEHTHRRENSSPVIIQLFGIRVKGI